MIAIWKGGLAIYGGVIGGIIAAIIFSKRINSHFSDLLIWLYQA